MEQEAEKAADLAKAAQHSTPVLTDTFQPGDTVILMGSTERVMKVDEVAADGVKCHWRWRNMDCTGTFPQDKLEMLLPWGA
jgi:hypothetical protein